MVAMWSPHSSMRLKRGAYVELWGVWGAMSGPPRTSSPLTVLASLHAVRLPPLQVAALQHRRVHAAARPLALQHQRQLVTNTAPPGGIEARRGRSHVRGEDHVVHLHQ